MKATKLLLLLPLLLAGCNQGGSETPSETLPPVDSSTETSTEAPDTSDQSDLLSARKAVNSLRGVDHIRKSLSIRRIRALIPLKISISNISITISIPMMKKS